MIYKIELPYPVPLNRLYRVFCGRVLISKEGRDWKKYAALQARAAGVRRIEGPVTVFVTLHPKTKKDGKASKVRVDLDSVLKVLLDSLSGVAYIDDSQVERIIAEIGAPRIDGGLTVTISPCAGVFEKN